MVFNRDTVFLLGDSITQFSWEYDGIAARLARYYERSFDVINRGVSGYNTTWGIEVFKRTFPKRSANSSHVTLLTIWFGANDATIPPKTQYVPLEDYEARLKELLALVRSPESQYYSPDTHIVLITPPPIDQTLWGDRKLENTQKYAEVVKRVGKELGIPVVDSFTGIMNAAGNDVTKIVDFTTDGLHLNAPGYKVVGDALINTIEEHFPELRAEAIPKDFPAWDTVDPDQYKNSIDTHIKSLEAR